VWHVWSRVARGQGDPATGCFVIVSGSVQLQRRLVVSRAVCRKLGVDVSSSSSSNNTGDGPIPRTGTAMSTVSATPLATAPAMTPAKATPASAAVSGGDRVVGSDAVVIDGPEAPRCGTATTRRSVATTTVQHPSSGVGSVAVNLVVRDLAKYDARCHTLARVVPCHFEHRVSR
jgi:hypothetical protein